jgi:type IV pilus assembly protein PilE
MGLANAMERVFTENNTYAPGGSAPTLGSGGIYPDQAPIDGTTKYYNLTIQAASGSAYTLRATPISGGAQDEDGYLELQSTGVRGWDKNNDGDTTDAGENSWEH